MRSVSQCCGVTAAALAASFLIISPALAQRAPSSVTVTNARTEALTALVIQTAEASPRVVAKLAKPLGGGKSQKLNLSKAKGCSYNVLAQFADESEAEAEALDLCKDPKIRLTE
ncbi:MAG: hypothetical protein ACRCWO_01725 [Bosea sp. (in: a-proteobacteria)]